MIQGGKKVRFMTDESEVITNYDDIGRLLVQGPHRENEELPAAEAGSVRSTGYFDLIK